MSILIKKVQFNKKEVDILIEDNIISKIDDDINEKADIEINGKDKAVLPGFINGHTHAAMTLFRGYGDDMPLREWLTEKIWPLEAKLTEEDVYWGTKLACLEMIKTGTVFFNDMYWHAKGSARAVEEMGIRALLNAVFIDFGDLEKAKKQIEENIELFEESKKWNNRIQLSLGPHAPYSVSKESLQWVKEFADKNNLQIHIHVSETENEVKESIEKFGKRPIEYLEEIGFLGPNVIACHAIWLDEKEIEICAEKNVKIIYNPISNLKLASGQYFPYQKLINKRIKIGIGTDGVASNNNLDILESAKFAALLQKSAEKDPMVLSANEAIEIITKKGAEIFNLNSGEVKEGKLADLVLTDLKRPELTPNHNLNANLIYAGNGSCVDTVICDGKILMENGEVEGEDEIMERARDVARKLVG